MWGAGWAAAAIFLVAMTIIFSLIAGNTTGIQKTRNVVARNERGGGILGVIDGYSPLGVEDDEARVKRRDFLRMIGYKLK